MGKSCLDRSTLTAVAKGRYPKDKLAEVKRHLERCPRCRAGVVAAAVGVRGPGDTVVYKRPGTTVRRGLKGLAVAVSLLVAGGAWRYSSSVKPSTNPAPVATAGREAVEPTPAAPVAAAPVAAAPVAAAPVAAAPVAAEQAPTLVGRDEERGGIEPADTVRAAEPRAPLEASEAAPGAEVRGTVEPVAWAPRDPPAMTSERGAQAPPRQPRVARRQPTVRVVRAREIDPAIDEDPFGIGPESTDTKRPHPSNEAAE
jgi:ribosomal protein S27AE